METKVNIGELVQDDLNFNDGTKEGQKMIDESFARYGAARSVVVDRNNRIISGNKSVLSAEAAGIKDVIVVESDGDELIAVRRTDVDLDTKKGREMALADNVTANVNFNINYDNIQKAIERFEIHTELWDVKPRETGNTLNRYAAEANTTKSIPKLLFGIYVISLTQEENEELSNRAAAYERENGTLDGFFLKLIKESNERNQ